MTENEKVKLRNLLTTLKTSCDILEELLEEKIEDFSQSNNDNFSRKVSLTLNEMGLSLHLLGFSYIQTAIVLLHTSDNYIDSAKVLYLMIAEKHNSSYSKVERGIRHSIKKLWTIDLTEKNLDTIQLVLGYSPLNKYKKPTNLEFLYRLAEFFKN